MSYAVYKDPGEYHEVNTLREVKKLMKGLYPELKIKTWGLLRTINTEGVAYYYDTPEPTDFEITGYVRMAIK